MIEPDLNNAYKELPNNEDAERLVIGSILIDNDNLFEVEQTLWPEDFYSPLCRRIYAAMMELSKNGISLNPVLIGNHLKQIDSSYGTVSDITNLSIGIPFGIKLEEYTKIIKDKSTLRKLIKECHAIANGALYEEESVEDTIQIAESKLFAITEDGAANNKFDNIGPLVLSSLERTRQLELGEITLEGISSDFTELDSRLGGFQKTDLIIIAARPSVGKTSLGLALSQNAAIRNGKNVAFFSLEMSKQQLVDRVLCSEAEINSSRYRAGVLNSDEWARLEIVSPQVSSAGIYINDMAGIGTNFVRSTLRRLIKQSGSIDLVVIDYLQLMSGNLVRNENRQQEVTQISRELKAIAKEFGLPVIALSQLNRQSENRANHRPTLADLRESGSIEQDADVVMFIYREDLYNPNLAMHTNLAEIIIAKNRNGPVGTINLKYDPVYTKFSNLGTSF